MCIRDSARPVSRTRRWRSSARPYRGDVDSLYRCSATTRPCRGRACRMPLRVCDVTPTFPPGVADSICSPTSWRAILCWRRVPPRRPCLPHDSASKRIASWCGVTPCQRRWLCSTGRTAHARVHAPGRHRACHGRGARSQLRPVNEVRVARRIGIVPVWTHAGLRGVVGHEAKVPCAFFAVWQERCCLLYTSDAADE